MYERQSSRLRHEVYETTDGNGNGNGNVTEQWLCACVVNLCTFFFCRPLQNNDLRSTNFVLSGEREPTTA